MRPDRATGVVTNTPVGDPMADPTFTVSAALGLVGENIFMAYGRFADNTAVLEVRDRDFNVTVSIPTPATSFVATRVSASAVDMYVGNAMRWRAEGTGLSFFDVDPEWSVIGGLEGYTVETGFQIRLHKDSETWSAEWPHTQISPPAVVRRFGDKALFTLETELTSVIGLPTGGALQWLPIEGIPSAPGIGVALLPLLDSHRLGQFYLGLEVPHPEQPLRYFGYVCDVP